MPINTGRREDGASMYSRRGPRLSAWRGDSPALPRGLKVVFAFAQGAEPAACCRLSAVRCPFPAGHCHSEGSEESRCLLLVISMPINTGRREGGASMYSRRGPRLSAWRGDSPALPRGLKVVFAFAQGAEPAACCRLSAVRCPFPAGHCHSERSEESRCVQYLRQTVLNTGRREGTVSMYSR